MTVLPDESKVTCDECHWKGTLGQVDRVLDPNPLPNTEPDMWHVCPRCRTPEHIVMACDEEHCWERVTCGTPTPEGYRNTCSVHAPWRKADGYPDATSL
jgi:hypothetical protein